MGTQYAYSQTPRTQVKNSKYALLDQECRRRTVADSAIIARRQHSGHLNVWASMSALFCAKLMRICARIRGRDYAIRLNCSDYRSDKMHRLV